MREILFRGKRVDNGEWVEGFLLKDTSIYGKPENHVYIVNHEHPSGCFGSDIFIEVDPDTVGQYTGQTDKNGKKIFEGDNVLLFETNSGVVVYDDNSAGFAIPGDGCGLCVSNANEREVIGNIHDNPELMGGTEDKPLRQA